MKQQFFRFALYPIIIYLTCGTFNPACLAHSPPAGENGTLFGDVIDGQSQFHRFRTLGTEDSKQPDKRYSDQFPNRRYARTSAANLNVGEPRTVRLIYYLPNDRPYRAEVVQQMKTDILLVQDFYAREMRLHGHGNITFRVETDPQGEPMIHRMDGGHPDSHYVGSSDEILGIVEADIIQRFDYWETNIYVVLVDISQNTRAGGGRTGKYSGIVTVENDSPWKILAHELGHAFGLDHDFSNDNYIMSYGSSQNQLSACSAEYLSVHPYFNPNVHPEDTRPTIELISPQSYPAGAKNVSIKLKVSDAKGLRQVRLSVLTPPTLSPKYFGTVGIPEVKACQGLAGETDTIVEFSYDGVIPSANTSLSIPTRHPIRITAIDANGNTGSYSFDLESDSPESILIDNPLSTGWGIELADHEGKSVASILSERPDLGLLSLSFSHNAITDLVEIVSAVSTGRPHLKRLGLSNNLISDISPIASLTDLTYLNLYDNPISDISPLSGLTNLTYLNFQYSNISDISPLSGLNHLTTLSLSHSAISDISPLLGLNHLETLKLADNNISDISPIASLTNLRSLILGHNPISDISPLLGLNHLETLNLNSSNISDISALADMNRLEELSLYNNTISDLSVLTGLPQLRVLGVEGNPLSYTSINTHVPTLQARGVQVSFNKRTLTKLVKRSKDLHIAPAASVPIIVEAQASSGGGFEGVPVTFTLTAGSGTLSTTFTNTDRNGRAESTLTLGTDLGTRIVEVSVPEIAQPVTFTIVGRQGVIIPDPNLRAKISEALGKASADRINPSEIATLTRLDARNINISNLTGLEHATNLTTLLLNYNNISAISPLLGLTNLEYLDLNGNNISDISAVSGLTNLTTLVLNYNNIPDISAVSGLTNLTTLNLGSNNISDISAVSGLTNLKTLNLGSNNILDISTVSGLTDLTYLDLSNNNISDISAVSGLTNLTTLNLGSNNISDISAVSGLTNLKTLNLAKNNISAISPLLGLTNLEYLQLQQNSITDISPLVANTGLDAGNTVGVQGNPLSPESFTTYIPALQSRGVTVLFDAPLDIPDPNLRAAIEKALGRKTSDTIIVAADMKTVTALHGGPNISDLTGLEHATNLIRLNLAGNNISDISLLAGLTNLTELILSGNNITDISPLAGLISLKGLNLGNNNITDISALSGLTRLGRLFLSDNNITDISPLAGLIDLTTLILSDNNITDISPLAGLIDLTELNLSGNNITDISPLAGLIDLTTLILSNNNITDISSLAGLIDLTTLILSDNNITDISPLVGLTNLKGLRLKINPIENASVLCPLIEQNPDLKVNIEIDCELAVSADTDLIHLPLGAVKATALLQNYPNPFNPETWIPYLLADDAFVTLTIHDESGGLVRAFDVGYQRAGVYQHRSRAVYWDGRNQSGEQVASGVYFYQLDAGDYSATRKMLILK